MSFLLKCPNCGDRSVYEFRFGGKLKPRPAADATEGEWLRYSYEHENAAGPQREWWYHRLGCRQWFFAVRDTCANSVEATFFPEEGA
ncbi:MAG: sarcosine oxidase subunit delta [Planctomycetes bacterium]|nr:sarcosine oxidase subunit delta [Planctomycetota bacterium]